LQSCLRWAALSELSPRLATWSLGGRSDHCGGFDGHGATASVSRIQLGALGFPCCPGPADRFRGLFLTYSPASSRLSYDWKDCGGRDCDLCDDVPLYAPRSRLVQTGNLTKNSADNETVETRSVLLAGWISSASLLKLMRCVAG